MGELLDNFLKVYQLANFIKHQKLAEQMQAQEFAASQQQHRYAQQQQDFTDQMHLADIGATENTPDIQRVTGAMTEAFGAPSAPNPKVTTPAGRQYYVPRVELQQQKLLDQIQAKGQIESGIKANDAFNTEFARQRAKLLFGKSDMLSISPEIAQTLNLGEVSKISKDQLKVAEDQYNRMAKEDKSAAGVNQHIITGVDDNGNVTAAAIDPKTLKVTPIGPISGVKAKETKEAKAGAGISRAAQSAQAQFEKAKDAVAADIRDGKAAPNALKDLTAMRDRIVGVYSDELDKGPSLNGWPDLVPKKKAAAAAPAVTDPKLKAYADKYFGGDVERARAYAAAHP